MNKKLIPIIFIILLSSFVIAVEYSDVVVPTLSFDLERTYYGLNDMLDGELILSFTGPPISDTFILSAFNETYEITFTEILNLENITYTEVSAESGIGNAENSVTLSPGEMTVVQLPRYSDIQSVTMDVEGDATFPYLDFGGEGYVHWFYLGTFLGYIDSYVTPTNLGETDSGTSVINTNKNYYCEVIDFPYSKNFEVSAKYKTLITGTKLKAVILSMPGGDPVNSGFEGGSDTCDLPENSGTNWGSCDIELGYAAEGHHLVCVYVANNVSSNVINLAIENEASTSTAFTCPIGGGYCTSTSPTDFFIKVKIGDYEGVLSDSTTFEDWFTFYDSPVDGLDFYVGADPYLGVCKTEICGVPIVYNSEDSGSITLSNPSITYESASVTQTTNKFYEFVDQEAYISEIDAGYGLEEITTEYLWEFSFPLDFFNVVTPADLENGLYDLQIDYNSASIIITINVSAEYEIEVEQTLAEEVQNKIDSAITALQSLDATSSDIDTILSILSYDLSGAVTVLQNYKTTLETLEEDSEIESLQTEVDTYLESIPKSITILSDFQGSPLASPSDIEAVIGTDYQDVYFYQNDFKITSQIQKFSILFFDGTYENAVFVQKTVKALDDASQIYVYEIIDKNIAYDTSYLFFEETPTVVENDPILKWYIGSLGPGESKTYSYIIDTSSIIDTSGLDTVIIPSGSVPVDYVGTTTCGDGICTVPLETKQTCPDDCGGINWLLIVIVLILFVALLFYINWYRGKWNFKDLTRGKNPFKSEADLKAIVNYIQTMSARGTPNQTIIDNLKKTGWTDKQITYAFEEAELEKKVKKIPKKAANTVALKTYITAAMQKGLTKEKIRFNLIKAGWNKDQVEQAYSNIEGSMKKKLSVKKWTFGLFGKK
ncbi:MAG: hypothetical protein ABIF40_03055 [archaeon]